MLSLVVKLSGAVVESIWLKQGRKCACQLLMPEVAWPLMDSRGSGDLRFPEMGACGGQAAPEDMAEARCFDKQQTYSSAKAEYGQQNKSRTSSSAACF